MNCYSSKSLVSDTCHVAFIVDTKPSRPLNVLEFDVVARIPSNVLEFHLKFLNVLETDFFVKKIDYAILTVYWLYNKELNSIFQLISVCTIRVRL